MKGPEWHRAYRKRRAAELRAYQERARRDRGVKPLLPMTSTILGVRLRFDRVAGRKRVERFVDEVCEKLGTTREELLRAGNRKGFVDMRRRIAIAAKKEGYSLAEIGRALDRHHTSILALVRGRR